MFAGWRWKLIWPVVLASVCLVGLCIFTAISLLHQQAMVHRAVHDDLKSRRTALELDECLNDTWLMEKDQAENVTVLHNRAREHLQALAEVADEEEERREVANLTTVFNTYLERWNAMPPRGDPQHSEKFDEARQFLKKEVLDQCQTLVESSNERLDQTTRKHERVLQQLAWGMAVVAVLGCIAGLVVGFGVARALSQSIRRLQVRVRDAAGKLAPNPPEIIFSGDGDFGDLHAQIDQLTDRIETVVDTLQQREREVLRAEQLAAVGQLAAGVGHEVRNPLTAIKMLVQTAIAEGSPNSLTKEDLSVIEEEIRRIEQSLKTFLDFARPPKAERQHVDFLNVLRAVTGLIRGRANRQKVTISVDSPEPQVMLTADPAQLRQVILNLCLNALDAMPTGGELRIRVRPHEREAIGVEVSDTGSGIPPTMMPRLFTPFASTKDTGLGLGLPISKRIVEDHGGTIGATNRPGRGATFFVTLPRQDK